MKGKAVKLVALITAVICIFVASVILVQAEEESKLPDISGIHEDQHVVIEEEALKPVSENNLKDLLEDHPNFSCEQTDSEGNIFYLHCKNVTHLVVPTCCEDGYRDWKCAICDAEGRDLLTNRPEHTYVNGVCTVCGAVEPKEEPVQPAAEQTEEKTEKAAEEEQVNIFEQKETAVEEIFNAES